MSALSSPRADAATYTWTSTTTGTLDWTTAGNWFGSNQYVSDPSNELVFFSDSTTNIAAGTRTITTNVPATLSLNTLTLNGKGASSGASSSTITIGTSASTWTIGDGTTSIVNLNGTQGATGAADFNITVGANLILNQSQTLFTGNGTAGNGNNTAYGPGFTFSGAITEASSGYSLIKSGTSRLTLSSNNLSFTGGITVNGGVLFLTGNSTLNLANGITIDGASSILQIGNNTATQLTSGANPTGTYGGNFILANGGTLQFRSSANQILTGSITGAGGLTKMGTGTLTLSDTNTYTGKTVIAPTSGPTSAGTLVVSSFNSVNGGTPLRSSSSLGAPTTVANGTIDLGAGIQATAALQYSGLLATGETTDRVINLIFNSSGTRTLNASGSGLLRFTSAFTSNATGTGAFILSGTGTGQIDQGLPQLSTAGLDKQGTGIWTLGGSGLFTGSTRITNGILSLSNATALQNSPFDTTNSVLGGASAGLRIATTTLTLGGLTGSNAFDTRFTTTSGGYSGLTALTLNTASGATPSYSAAIVDGATGMTLTKSGAGTQTLSGANTFTGATTVSAGTLILDYATQNNSKLSDSASLTLGNATLTLSGGSHTEVVSSTILSENTASSITRSSGTSVIQLGNITVNTSSSLNLGASGIATTNNTNNSFGILGFWATITGEGWAVNSTNGANGSITGAAYTDLTRLSSGTKALTGGSAHYRIIEGTGTAGDITMASAGTTSIDTLVNAATTAGTVDIGTGNILSTSAILQGTGAGALTIGVLATPGSLTALTAGGDLGIVANSANTITINSLIANNTSASSLTKYGSGQLTITTNPTYTGATIISGGTLDMSGIASNPLNSSSGLTFTGTGTFVYEGGTAKALPSTTVNSGVTANFRNSSSGSNTSFTMASLSGSGTFSVDNPGGSGQGKGITFGNMSSFTGVLRFQNTGSSFYFATPNLNDTVASNIVFAGNATSTAAGFRYTGSAGLTLTNRAFELSGSAGHNVEIRNDGTSNSNFIINSNLVVSGGAKTLTLRGTNTGGTSAFNGNVVNGTGSVISVTKSDTNTWALNGTSNTFTGTITLSSTTTSAGTLSYASAGGNNPITFSQTTGTATLSYTGSGMTMSGAITASALTSGTITLNASGAGAINYSNTASLGAAGSGNKNLVLSGTNTGDNIFAGRWVNNTGGAATLAKQGAGRWILTNANNTYSGGTTIGNNTANAGILDVRASGALGTGTVSIVSNTGNGFLAQLALNHATGITLTNNFNTSGTNGVILNQTGNNVISGNIALIGGGGNTTINSDGGSLTLSGGISINVAFDRTLTLGGSAAGTVSGVISNGLSPQVLSVVKSDSGTWTFSNNSNTYTGATNVNAGTLLINGSIATSSLTTVASGATLGGSGTVGAAIINGTLAVGNSPGQMNFTNTLTLAGITIMEIDGNAGVGVSNGHDFANLTGVGAAGVLTYGGTMTLDMGVLFGAGTYSWNLFDMASETGTFTSITLAD